MSTAQVWGTTKIMGRPAARSRLHVLPAAHLDAPLRKSGLRQVSSPKPRKVLSPTRMDFSSRA